MKAGRVMEFASVVFKDAMKSIRATGSPHLAAMAPSATILNPESMSS